MTTAPLPLKSRSRVITIDIQRNLKKLHSIHGKLKPMLYAAGDIGEDIAQQIDDLDYELMQQIHQLLLMHVEAAKGSRSGDGE